MNRIENIRRIDMFCVGQMFKVKISRYGEGPENITFLTDTEDGKEKLQALEEFVNIFNLENKSFLVNFG